MNLPPDHTFTFAEEAGEPWGVWTADVCDMEGNLVFTSSYTDRRLTLLNAYGFVWRSRYKPQNPVWQRRRDDLRERARSGIMHLPGAEAVPDPDDLDPGSVFDLGSKERT